MTIREGDPANRLPIQVQSVSVRVFDLSKEDQLKEYETICNQICRGECAVSVEERIYGTDIQSWRVFLRWVETYYTNPPEEGLQS